MVTTTDNRHGEYIEQSASGWLEGRVSQKYQKIPKVAKCYQDMPKVDKNYQYVPKGAKR